MQRLITRLGPWFVGLALGCSGSAKWEVGCGCAPLMAGFGSEIRIPPPNDSDSITPESVREWFVAHADGKPYYLDELRALGPFSNQGCARSEAHNSLRCVYWLWTRGNEYRGIEVTFTHHDGRVSDLIQARYIFDRG